VFFPAKHGHRASQLRRLLEGFSGERQLISDPVADEEGTEGLLQSETPGRGMGDEETEARELLEAIEAIEALEALEALEAVEAIEEEEVRRRDASPTSSSPDPPPPNNTPVPPAKNLKRQSREARMLETDTVAGGAGLARGASASATPESGCGGSASRPKRDSPSQTSSSRDGSSRRASVGSAREEQQPLGQHPQAPDPPAGEKAYGKRASLERAAQPPSQEPPQTDVKTAPMTQPPETPMAAPTTAGPHDDHSAPLRRRPPPSTTYTHSKAASVSPAWRVRALFNFNLSNLYHKPSMSTREQCDSQPG